VNGAVIGAIGVSGMKAAEDGEIARAGAGVYTRPDGSQ
jgi:uncharacterized protein GlcG (DUF336 family)